MLAGNGKDSVRPLVPVIGPMTVPFVRGSVPVSGVSENRVAGDLADRELGGVVAGDARIGNLKNELGGGHRAAATGIDIRRLDRQVWRESHQHGALIIRRAVVIRWRRHAVAIGRIGKTPVVGVEGRSPTNVWFNRQSQIIIRDIGDAAVSMEHGNEEADVVVKLVIKPADGGSRRWRNGHRGADFGGVGGIFPSKIHCGYDVEIGFPVNHVVVGITGRRDGGDSGFLLGAGRAFEVVTGCPGGWRPRQNDLAEVGGGNDQAGWRGENSGMAMASVELGLSPPVFKPDMT